jgi:hypothetical protein
MLDATLRDRARSLLTASGRSDVPPFMVMDVMAAAARIEAAGGHVIHMEVGQPAAPGAEDGDIGRPRRARRGRIDYTSALGIPRCARASPGTTATTYGCAVDAERIVVTTGRRARSSWLSRHVRARRPRCGHGSRLSAVPPYPHRAGCEPVLIETSSETRHALTGDACSPPPQDAAEGRAGRKPGQSHRHHDVPRGAHQPDIGGGRRGHPFHLRRNLSRPRLCVSGGTAAELSPHALVINSFSKYFCMTGWRVGWMVVPEPLVRPIERLQQNLAISVPTLSQIAAEAAFEGRDEMEEVKRGYQENRRILIAGLPQAGLNKFLPADGAFYLYADVSDSPPTVSSLPNRCWNRRASRQPRDRFRSGSRPSFIRFCYARSAEEMREAVARIARWLG